MSKVFKYAIAYGMWFVDLGLSAWLFYVSRTTLLAFLALFYAEGDFQQTKTAGLIDKAFSLLLVIGWFAFFVFTEEYYRAGALEENLMKRFARVTGPLLLCVFFCRLDPFRAARLWRWQLVTLADSFS